MRRGEKEAVNEGKEEIKVLFDLTHSMAGDFSSKFHILASALPRAGRVDACGRPAAFAG